MSNQLPAAIAICALLGGCASSEIVWTKKGGRIAPDEVVRDGDQCRAQAVNAPRTLPARAEFTYIDCMRRSGWYQIEITTDKYYNRS